ncbi:MAG TPA: condensation domain-containing protein, partial [Kofleriaceae bacterium]|nr:condensation domain-containing protein [Kofleriaceae bacterium]
MSDPRDELERRRRELSASKRELLARRLRGDRLPAAAATAAPAGIPRRAPGTSPPLSLPQQRLWFLDQLAPGDSTYNEPAAVRLSGPLDEAALRASLDALVARHEILRTRFVITGDEPRQEIAPPAALPLAIVDVAGDPLPHLLADAARPFDLARGPLIRATLYRLGRDEAVLLLAMHHIVCDGWSMAVLLRELGELYAAAHERREPRLPPLAIQYGDVAAWQRRPEADAELAPQLAYWDRQLAGTLPSLSLPFGRPPPRTPSGRGGTLSLAMPDAVRRAALALARAHEATLFMTISAAFAALLQRYTGAGDLLLATPSANRNRVELEALVGFFVNTLVLRVDASNDPPFAELLARVKATCVGAFSHEEVPFDRLVERHRPERDHRPPLAQIELAQQPPLPASLTVGALRMAPLGVPRTRAKFDQEWHFWETAAGLDWLVVYDGDLFDPEALTRMFGHLETLLVSACAEPTRRLSELALLTAAERHRLVVALNDSAAPHPHHRTVSALIADQAARTPDAIAVSDAGRALSYRALGALVTDRARRLVAAGVGRDRLVALLATRDIDFLVHVLAVLEAGGAYLPLDPRHPPARLAQVLEQSRVPVVVCADALRATAEAALAA